MHRSHRRARSAGFLCALIVMATACGGSNVDDAADPTPQTSAGSAAPSSTAPASFGNDGNDIGTAQTEVPPDREEPAQPPSDGSGDDLVFEPTDQMCAYGAPEPITTLSDGRLVEVSGLGFSRLAPDLVWAHNDSGDGANVYGSDVDPGAVESGTAHLVTAEGVFAIDWEDMAVVGEPGLAGQIYVGDIGDNRELRAFVFVYRFSEPPVRPDPASPQTARTDVVTVERYALAYPDGARDAEALVVDPLDGDLFIITKGTEDDPPTVYRAPASDLRDGARINMDTIATLELDGQVTAADMTHDGDRVVVRTYDEVLIYPRVDDDLTATFARAPCVLTGPDEPQGEAVAFDAEDAIVVVSEGQAPVMYRYAPQP